MLTAMQMKYFKEDLNAVLWKVVERERILGIDASVTATIMMADPMKVEFSLVAIFEKLKNKGSKSLDKNNFKKRNSILKNKEDIISKYNNDIPMTRIAKVYGVSIGCISNNLKLWGVRKKHGLKFLLRNLIKGANN